MARSTGELGLFKIICIIGAVLSIVGVIVAVLQGVRLGVQQRHHGLSGDLRRPGGGSLNHAVYAA